MKLMSKRSKFNNKVNWTFNSNVLMSIKGVPISESGGKSPRFIFHLTKSVSVTQTRICRLTWFSGRLCGSIVLINHYLIFALHWNIVILRSLHRYSEYWRRRSQTDSRYFGSYMVRSAIYKIYVILWAWSYIK